MINLQCTAGCPADMSIAPHHSSQAANLLTGEGRSTWYLETWSKKEAVISCLWNYPGLKDKTPRNNAMQKKLQGEKKNQPSNQKTYNVSSPKLGVQTPQNLPGSIKMTGFGHRCARFRGKTHWKHQTG